MERARQDLLADPALGMNDGVDGALAAERDAEASHRAQSHDVAALDGE